MSDNAFKMASGQPESQCSLPQRGSSEAHTSMPVSPDSNRSISYMNVRGASSSADISMPQSCLSQCSHVDIFYNTTLTQGDVFCGVAGNLNQTFIATPVSDSIHFWKQNLSLMSNEEFESFRGHRQEDESNSTVMSQSSCTTSCRGSTENDCCSLSSGEMVMRTNSFCLEDQSLLLVSSLDESSITSAAPRPKSPDVPDVCNKSMGVAEENTGHPCLGATFIRADSKDLLTEENEMGTSSYLVALPNENEGGLFRTFICETSPDCGKEANCASGKAWLLTPFSAAFTPEQGKTVVSTLSNTQEIDEDVHTSTPVQNTENKKNSLPLFSESPCIGNANSSGLPPVKQQQVSVTNKQCLAPGLPPSASKGKKMEIKRFPKPDFSRVKSKIITREPHQTSVPGIVSLPKQSENNLGNKRIESLKRTTCGTFPAKGRSSTTVVSATTKMFNDGQKVDTGAANLGVQSCEHPAVDGQGKSREAPAGQCSKPSSQTEGPSCSQVSETQHAYSQTSFSSLEKSTGKSGVKPTPKKDASNKAEVRSGSSFGRDKFSAFETRPRCSSDSSSLTPRPPKEKQTFLKFSASFSKAVTPQNQTKPKSLSCSNQNKRAIQAENIDDPTQNSPRDVKKISLVVSRDSTNF